jgi:hypothetical protein
MHISIRGYEEMVSSGGEGQEKRGEGYVCVPFVLIKRNVSLGEGLAVDAKKVRTIAQSDD